jgi:(S)-ureidoglycine aminohydrolase
MKSILFSTIVIGLATAAGLPLMRHHQAGRDAMPQSDTLTSGVHSYPGDEGQVLKGATHDLSVLDIRSITPRAGGQSSQPGGADSLDELLIVKEGSMIVSIGDSITRLGAGGVALFAAGQTHYVGLNAAKAATYYLFRFRSRSPEDRNRAGQAGGNYPFLLDWTAMHVQHTAIGESRQIFSQPTPWLSKIDMHATTLNPGEVSHPPHIHRSEEIILMRSGHVQEYINGKHYPATAGDLIFLASGSLHAVENTGTERCEYFALQWQQ